MAGSEHTSKSVSQGQVKFNGGLNSTSGPLNVADNESSDLQNIDFDKFGSILKRNGYSSLNTVAITNAPNSDGLWWYEYDDGGSATRKLINIADGSFWKMDDLDGNWDVVYDTFAITADSHCDFSNFLNTVYITNGVDDPFEFDGTDVSSSTLPTNVTRPKFNEVYKNFLFYANVFLSGAAQPSRVMWSDIKNTGSWSTLDFIDIRKDDGQPITGIKILGERLIIFKERTIHALTFTGDTDIPFVPNQTNSPVGCIAPYSIQEVDNGLMFLSYDGFYFFDGNTSLKVSDRITKTLLTFNDNKFEEAKSLVQKNKNRYWCALPSSGQTTNDKVLMWDYFNNAWSVYDGIAISACTTVYVDGKEERPYFGDYNGWVYRADNGVNDNPLGIETAIDAYYYTNWKPFGDLINKKALPQVTIYHQTGNAVLTYAYSYDFETGDQYSQTLSLATSADTYGSGIYDTAIYAGSGGGIKRRDLTGRGRVVRQKFANDTIDETFQIDGIGMYPHLETNI